MSWRTKTVLSIAMTVDLKTMLAYYSLSPSSICLAHAPGAYHRWGLARHDMPAFW